MDEIEVHRAVFKADAAHLLVQGMRGGFVLHAHGEVDLVVAQVIGLGAVAQPGQLQLKRRGAVGEVDQDEGAVRRFLPAVFLEAECFVIKREAFLQVKDVQIGM